MIFIPLCSVEVLKVEECKHEVTQARRGGGGIKATPNLIKSIDNKITSLSPQAINTVNLMNFWFPITQMHSIKFWPLDHSDLNQACYSPLSQRGESIECEELPLLLTSCVQRFGSTRLASPATSHSCRRISHSQHALPGDLLPATGMPSELLRFSLLVPWLLGRRPPSVCPIEAPCLWAALETAMCVICDRNKPPVCILAGYMESSLYSIL